MISFEWVRGNGNQSKHGGIGSEGEYSESGNNNRQGPVYGADVGYVGGIVTGVCRNSVMIENFQNNQKWKTIRKSPGVENVFKKLRNSYQSIFR